MYCLTVTVVHLSLQGTYINPDWSEGDSFFTNSSIKGSIIINFINYLQKGQLA